MEKGELEIGQIAGLIYEIKPAAQIVEEMVLEFNLAKAEINHLKSSLLRIF